MIDAVIAADPKQLADYFGEGQAVGFFVGQVGGNGRQGESRAAHMSS